MPDNRNPHIAALFHRDPVTDAVAVADGYGLSLRVNRGHLVIEDGIGRHRRTRRYSRAERTLRRIVVLGQAGYLSLEAVRWCADIGVALLHVDSAGRVLTVHGAPGTDDPRLRRAQAAAASSAVGIDIAHRLLGAKLDGQVTVLREALGAHTVADLIRDLADQLQGTNDLIGCRDVEAKASNIYFGTWAATVSCRFTERDAARVPDHWTTFAWMPNYAREVAHHAEAVAHMLAKTSPGKIDLRTPLTRANTIASQTGDQRRTARHAPTTLTPNPTCRTCGTTLTDRTRQLCATCWPVTRAKLAMDRAAAANQVLAKMRANGEDPSTSPDATARRSAALAQRKREELAWKDNATTHAWTGDFYKTAILPGLIEVPLSAIQQATGLSVSACSRIRSGKLTPHKRHWNTLRKVTLS